jgi:hypothetical protein
MTFALLIAWIFACADERTPSWVALAFFLFTVVSCSAQ